MLLFSELTNHLIWKFCVNSMDNHQKSILKFFVIPYLWEKFLQNDRVENRQGISGHYLQKM
jgi:hypothetical protein